MKTPGRIDESVTADTLLTDLLAHDQCTVERRYLTSRALDDAGTLVGQYWMPLSNTGRMHVLGQPYWFEYRYETPTKHNGFLGGDILKRQVMKVVRDGDSEPTLVFEMQARMGDAMRVVFRDDFEVDVLADD